MASRANEPAIVIRKVRKRGGGGHHGGAWKVAYADFVTAMMAFFMLLWLISTPDKEKLKGLAEYFTPESQQSGSRGEIPGLGNPQRHQPAQDTAQNGQPSPQPAAAGTARGGTANVPDATMRMIAQEMKIALDALPTRDAAKSVKLESSRDGLRINLMDTANRPMFRTGTAVLNDYARGLLTEVARKLARTGARIAIEGHTDAVGGQSDANWRLSGERALAARTAMIRAGLTPDRFSEVVALAGSQPIYPEQPDRPENRRITIVVIAEASATPSHVSFKF